MKIFCTGPTIVVSSNCCLPTVAGKRSEIAWEGFTPMLIHIHRIETKTIDFNDAEHEYMTIWAPSIIDLPRPRDNIGPG